MCHKVLRTEALVAVTTFECMALYWPYITDFSGLSMIDPCLSKGVEHSTYSSLSGQTHFTLISIN